MNYHLLSRAKKRYVSSLAKTSKHLLLLLALTVWAFSIHAQNRPNINTLNVDGTLTTTQEQEELAQAIHDFVDNNHWFLELHLTPLIHTVPGGTCLTNTSPNFLPWHRFFIGKLEEYLNSVPAYRKYVPLPKWDPSTTIPAAFFNGPYALATSLPSHFSTPPPDCGDCSGGSTTDLDFCPLVNQNITGTSFWTSVGSCNSGSVSSSNFYSNLSSNLCNYNTVALLGKGFGGGPGHHGNVHVAIGGAMGGCFHQAPGAMIFYLWHAFVDDVWKEWECGCSKAEGISGIDLYMKDWNKDDVSSNMMYGLDEGYEPFVTTLGLWESEDIWVRLQNDGMDVQVHENPDYSSTNHNYVYVRVRNRGCTVSNGTEQLKVYFTKRSTGMGWNPSGGSSAWVSNGIYGDIIGTVTIDPLAPGEIAVYEFQWDPPNPASFSPPETETHACLLARIETSSSAPFGMTFTETTSIWDNVKNNNNIIQKNVTIVNTPANGLLRVGNPCDHAVTLDFAFAVPEQGQGHIYIDEGDYQNGPAITDLGPQEMFTDFGLVTVNLGQDLFAKWVQGGRQGTGISADFYTHVDDAGVTQQYPLRYLVGEEAAPYTIAITGPNATLKNVDFTANEMQNVNVQFHYFTQDQGFERTDFEYTISQVAVSGMGSGCDGIGGNTYKIKRPGCAKPNAGADITVGPGCAATLDVNPAGTSYAWFNNGNGNLVGTTKSVVVYPTKTTTYEVQVIYPNGCVGYDLVTVFVDHGLPACNWRFHDLQVFPNPIAGGQQLTAGLITDESALLNITFMTMTGEIINEMPVTTNTGYNEYYFSTQGLSAGVYKLRVQALDGPGDITETITIQNN